jgi:hypothetical protein
MQDEFDFARRRNPAPPTPATNTLSNSAPTADEIGIDNMIYVEPQDDN